MGAVLYPLGLAVRYSLTDAGVGESGNYVGLAQYAYLLRDPLFLAAAAHTALYDALALAVKVVLGVLLALALDRKFRGRRAVMAVLLLPLLFPVVMESSTWYFLFSDVGGGINFLLHAGRLVARPYPFLGSGPSALLSLVAINAWHGTPLVMVLAGAGLAAVPGEVLEAARLDGAGRLQVFWRLQAPALLPGLAVAGLLSVLGTFGDYAIVHIVTAGGPGGETSIVSSLAFERALRAGDLATGMATALTLVPFHLVALVLAAAVVLRR